MSTPRMKVRGARPTVAHASLAVLVVGLLAGACDSVSGIDTAPSDECEQYVKSVERCFGHEMAAHLRSSLAPDPASSRTDDTRSRCSQHARQFERLCR